MSPDDSASKLPNAAHSASELAAVDEILQILYWLDGEGLARDAAAGDLVRWLQLDVATIEPVLKRMSGLGFVRVLEERRTTSGPDAQPRYQLTEAGRREGGRRFADEFSGMTKPGHGECGDPNCDCNETGDPADCQHLTH